MAYIHAVVAPAAGQLENQGKISSEKRTVPKIGERGVRMKKKFGGVRGDNHVVDAGMAFEEEPGSGIRSTFWQPHLLGLVSKARSSQLLVAPKVP